MQRKKKEEQHITVVLVIFLTVPAYTYTHGAAVDPFCVKLLVTIIIIIPPRRQIVSIFSSSYSLVHLQEFVLKRVVA